MNCSDNISKRQEKRNMKIKKNNEKRTKKEQKKNARNLGERIGGCKNKEREKNKK